MAHKEFTIHPRGMGYTIERTEKDGSDKHVLSVRGDAFKFSSRHNAACYLDLLAKDDILVRNDQWMPVEPPRTVYQGGRGVRRTGGASASY